jgi:type IV pilus assembly protein PilN
MAKINLLPWREELLREQTRQFATLTGLCAFMTCAMVGLVHFNISRDIDHQNGRNQILQSEISKLDISLKEIKGLEETKSKLLSRMEIIQSLQRQRPQIVHLFDELVRTVPDGLYLTSIKQNGDKLTIRGVAESNGRVSAYMRNIDASKWLSTPKLNVIESKKGTLRSSDFEITTSESAPKDKNDKKDKS